MKLKILDRSTHIIIFRKIVFLILLTIYFFSYCGNVFAFYKGSNSQVMKTSITNSDTGISSYADFSTVDSYKDILSSQDNGKIWTDKSVYKNDQIINLDGKFNINCVNDDSDFVEVFSALGSSQKMNYEKETGIDVSISLDISASMAIDDRIGKTVRALNEFIDMLMAKSPHNRIAVSVFGTLATEFIPLGHYYKKDDQDYITYKYGKIPGFEENSNLANFYQLQFTASKLNSDGSETEITKSLNNVEQWRVDQGNYFDLDVDVEHIGHLTNIRYGNYKALESLKNAELNKELNQIPVFILYTDGFANVINKNWENPDASWYMDFQTCPRSEDSPDLLGLLEPCINPIPGSGYGQTWEPTTYEDDEGTGVSDIIILQTLMSTAYKKTEVEQHYKEYNSDFQQLITYAVSVDLNGYYNEYGYNSYYEACIPVMDAILNPSKYFNGEYNSGELGYGPKDLGDVEGKTKNKYFSKYSIKVTNAYNKFQEWLTSSDTVTITHSILQDLINRPSFGFAQLPEDSPVTKEDIKRNINYVQSSNAIDITNDQIQDTFSKILDSMTFYHNAYIPIGDENSDNSDLSYVDPVGKYMEVKDIKNLLLFGKQYNIVPNSAKDTETNKHYKVVGENDSDVLIENPNYDNVKFNLSDIDIYTEKVTGNFDETLHIKIPKEALPIKTTSITIGKDGNISEYSYSDSDNNLPLRIIYTVGIANSIINENGKLRINEISKEYKKQYQTEIDGKKYLNFYSNYYDNTKYNEEINETIGGMLMLNMLHQAKIIFICIKII